MQPVREWLESRDDEELPSGDVRHVDPPVADEDDILVDTSPPTQAEWKLSFSVKFLYGLSDFGISSFQAILGFYLNAFLLEVAGVPPQYAGTILLVAKLVDAVMDPVIGMASDRTRSRFGRRKIWIACAMVPLSVCYMALWVVPASASQVTASKVAYYMCIMICLSLAMSCVQLPTSALAPELSENYDERTSLMVYKVGAFSVATIVATFVHSILIESFFYSENPLGLNSTNASGIPIHCDQTPGLWNTSTSAALFATNGTLNVTNLIPPQKVVNYELGYLVSGIVWGCVSIVPLVLLLLFVPEKQRSTRKKPAVRRDGSIRTKTLTAWNSFKAMVTNRAFICVMVIYLLSQLAIQFVQNNLFLYIKYVLEREEWFSYLLLVLLGTSFLFLPLWERVSRRLSKSWVYFLGVIIGIGCFSYNFFTEWMSPVMKDVTVWLVAVIAGVSISALFLVPVAMFPDVIEQDELVTGVRREGIYYSFFVFFQKMALAIALAISNFILNSSGYISPESSGCVKPLQPEGVILALSTMVSFVPVAALVLSLVALKFYPITKEAHLLTLQELEIRRKEKAFFTTDGEVSRSREADAFDLK